MPLVCEDLASHDVVLIAPTSQLYFDLLSDIDRRLQNRASGFPPLRNDDLARISEHDTTGSAILLNRAPVAIASIAYIWTFRRPDGRTTTGSSSPGTNPSVLLPFTQLDRTKKVDAYWNTIFPGSKRLLTAEGGRYGDNTDVRPPAADERSNSFAITAGGRTGAQDPLKLTLDGIFFVDGGFDGPDQLRTWDHVVSSREIFLDFAALARRTGPADFFAQIQKRSGLTGNEPRVGPRNLPRPLPPPHRRSSDYGTVSIREYHQQRIARIALGMRERLGDAAALASISAWQDTPGPQPHKLA